MTRSQLVFGIAFVAIGVVLLFDHAGRVEAWGVLATWWPMLVMLSGLAQLVTRPRNAVGGTVLLSIGAVLLGWTLGWITTVALVWPVALIALGVWLLAGRPGRAPHSGGLLDESAVFDDRAVAVGDEPLLGGSVTSVFGDLELDLRAASLGPDGATVNATTIFGDLALEIPAGWRVYVSGPELFGDVVLRQAQEPPAGAPTLRLRVLTVFGDLRVRAETPAAVSSAGSGSLRR